MPAAAGNTVMSIDDLIATVLAGNPELAIYETAIDAARAGQRQAGRWDNPEFTLEAGRKRVREVSGAGIAEGMAWAASVAQPIAFPGRTALRKAIAERDVELAEMGLAHFRLLLRNKVRSLGYALYRTRATAAATGRVASQSRELAGAVLQRETGGIAPLLEQRILESNTLTLQRRHQAAMRAYEAALIELNQLRAVPADTPLYLAEPPLEFPELAPVSGLVNLAWQHAFAAQARRVELEQQGYRVRLSHHERYPGVTITPFVAQETAGDRETVAGVGISLPLPVWDRNAGNIQAEKARMRQAEAALQVLRRDLERHVVTHALRYQSAREALLSMRPDAVEAFAQAAELAERHYQTGAIQISMYLEAQAAYLDALDALLELRQEALASLLELEMLAGPANVREGDGR
jgi:cobalt-zinc-cadmium efflux system outer membrane protein